MEEAESIISLARICRACLNERTQMKPLFDARLAEMMMACANIVVRNNIYLYTKSYFKLQLL